MIFFSNRGRLDFMTLFVWIAEVGGTMKKNPRITYLPQKGQVHVSVIGRDHIVKDKFTY